MSHRRRKPFTARTFAMFSARHGTAEEKFWPRVQVAEGCWLWLGAKTTWGYGSITVDGRARAAHRLSWEIHNGAIPVGLQVCHQCDVRDCVNPDHLFLGTAKENVADMNAKGRHGRGWRSTRRGEAHPAAKLTDAEVVVIREAIAAGQSYREIARNHRVSHTYVSKVARNVVRVA